MGSVFALLATAFFAYNAALFLPATGVYENAGAAGGLDGDAGAVALTSGNQPLKEILCSPS